ncbi:hypothetical protein ACPRR3_18700 [Enterobacter asburiae]|uniref:hypothetical protein n=1 Tax=Enterobacter asburiae TaxID=61645 RepID=UPI000FEB5FF2|nr:hypothetical protein [Enterobacter asburiae]ELW9470830.1 hypothetical protein [Enterobacter asburiae]MDC6395476.1 hypothetical protein [Enterobacter asburiae]MDC6403203.1 hypothetical protein [Enterobacter asburiae]MDG9840983.1 hypothetical protein [Enterobacter asburiae]QLV58247.1 hypothetical protein HV233_04980 [Enterobacter asburiae]
MSEVTDLVVIEKQNAMAVFTTKEQLDPIIEAIEKEARSLVPDVSTRKGRDAIASMAHKVARSKTYIDNAGKDLVAELKALPKQIDESRRIVRERLDALKDEVRKPLTDWENAESARKDALQQRLADLRSLADVIDGVGNYLPSVEIQQRIESAKAVALDESWQEAAAEAGVAKDAAIQQLEAALIVAKQREHEAAELERLRKEAEEKARLEREENIRREAAERARRDSEAKHKAEIEAAARREAEEKARAEAAERQRIEAEQRAEREKKETEERARREKEEAVAAERRRQEEAEAARLVEEQRKAEEEARRAADKEHRRTVNRRVYADLIAQGIPEEYAQKAVLAIAGGKVQDAHIKY